MRRARNLLSFMACTLMFLMMSASPALAGTVVVAGSSLEAPPPYWEGSFWGITPSIDRAFPFEIQPLGTYNVSELQVPVYHYSGLAGDLADFAIHRDDAGAPGVQIGAFQVTGIAMTQTVVSASLSEPIPLDSGERYWIVGSTASGQVNWNLGDSVFGEAAYRVDDGAWEHLGHANVSGFALLGTVVPEPSTLALLGLSGMVLLPRRRNR